MTALHTKDFTKEQLAKLCARGVGIALDTHVHAQESKALRHKQGGRRWAKRYVRKHGGDGTAVELDAILVETLRHPDLDDIKRLAAEVPPLPPRHRPERPIDPWLRCAQIVCDDPPGTGCDEFPGALDKTDVPEEWWYDARAWGYEPSPELVAHHANQLTVDTGNLVPPGIDYRDCCRQAYGHLVADSWMTEQRRRQEALQAVEELTNDLASLLDDLQELSRLENTDIIVYANTPGATQVTRDGQEPVEIDEWARLHKSRMRLRFLRSFRELVLQAEKYAPANEQVEKLLKG